MMYGGVVLIDYDNIGVIQLIKYLLAWRSDFTNFINDLYSYKSV